MVRRSPGIIKLAPFLLPLLVGCSTSGGSTFSQMLPLTTTTASKSPVSAVTHASLTLTAKTVTPWPWTVGSLLVFCGAPPVAVVGGVRYAILGSDSTSDALGYADPAALLIDPTDVQAAVFDAKVTKDCGLSESTTITGTTPVDSPSP